MKKYINILIANITILFIIIQGLKLFKITVKYISKFLNIYIEKQICMTNTHKKTIQTIKVMKIEYTLWLKRIFEYKTYLIGSLIFIPV